MSQLPPLPQIPSPFSFSGLAIRRHIGTLMLTLTVIVLGVFFLLRLQVDLLPSITYPRIGLRLDAPGITPNVAVEEITKPLEEALARTDGVVQIYSQTREGQVNVDLFFQPGGSIDQALNDATATFNRSRNQLPNTIEEPRIFKFDPSQLPVYEVALTSDSLSGRELRVFADEDLNRELSIVPGVAGVDVAGGATEEVRVLVDLDRLQAVGLGLNQLLGDLSSRNQDVAGGRIRGSQSESLTRTVGKFTSAQAVEDFPLSLENNRQVYLHDVATVIDGSAEQRVFVSLNGQPAVKLSVLKQPEANTIAVVEGVKKRFAELQANGLIPADITIVPVLDESIFIRNSLNNVITAGLTGTALAAFAVLLFLGSIRETLIIVLAIPLSTLVAMLLMGVFNFSLNVFSLGGLALGVGIVVDNAIVMLETLSHTPASQTLSQEQFIEEAKRRSQEIESALVASTLTNLVAILPFLLLGGLIALLFNELILTITFSVGASLLVALTVVPALASRLLAISYRSGLGQTWVFRTFNQKFLGVTQQYQQLLYFVLAWRFVVVGLAVLVLGGSSWYLAGQIPQELLPRISTGQVNLMAIFPPGTPVSFNRQVMAEVDRVLLAQPGTQAVFTTSGGSLFASNTTANAQRSSATIVLQPGFNLPNYITQANAAIDQLNLAGIRVRLSPGQVRGIILTNSPLRSDLDIVLRSNNEQALAQAGRQVLQALDEKSKLAQFRPDSDPRQPEVQILPDWQRATELGLSAQAIGATIQTAVEGFVPTEMQRGDRLVDIRVQLDQDAVNQPGQLAQIPLFVPNNRPIRLGDIANITTGLAPAEIRRINQQQVYMIAGTLNEKASLSAAIKEVQTIIQGLELPEGVSVLPSAAAQTNQQLQSALVVLGSLAAFLVFVVMAVQYNSLLDPLVIMLTIPLALSGSIWGLAITGTAIGATVIVGGVLLVGIVVNNAIILVERANQIYAEENVSRSLAILTAAPERLRPILMTTITTVIGMFPLALGMGEGSEFLQPLGIVVFSGLAVATLLTLFIIPCFYVILHGLGELKSPNLPVPGPDEIMPRSH